MMGAHSRPPNHTGDYSHHQQQQDETMPRLSLALPPQDRTDAKQKCSQLLLEQQACCSNSHGLQVTSQQHVALPCARTTSVRVHLS
ncbi:hypothetical protein E2C01_087966 [Portunus trituberculatus]|uniref:Uncharacterized protein n=1 Tax=Portunus trituberculatus TaxID=210409 RepID=A0A5B7JFG8_PORTR|nr:hypothetical protein [Portunus trituberculatus]